MNSNRPVKIIGTGKYLPKAIDSSAIETKFGIQKGWSMKYSGVASRHHVTFETGGYMGARAVENALQAANIQLTDVDLLISAGATFDYPLPSQACSILNELTNGKNIPIAAMDIDSTCLSFVSAFEIAARMLDGEQYKNVVIVSSEIASKGLNPKNPETLTLFGDAAVAVVLTYDETSESSFIKGKQMTFSEGFGYTLIKGGGNAFHFKDHAYNSDLHSFDMKGIKLLKLTKKNAPVFMDAFFQDLPYHIEDIDVIITHQASKTGLELFAKLYNLRPGQMKENLIDHGNCIAASIPLLLHDTIEKKELKRGDTCLLAGTSAGFSIGATLIRY